MSGAELQTVDVNGREIAVLATPSFASGRPANPARGGPCGLFWLPGYKSDMASTKAFALADFAVGRFGCTRFDYSGHGRSGGRFEDGTVGDWLDDAAAVFTQVTAGPQVVIGSSMGGYIALLLLRRLMEQAPEHAARIKAMVLIAPAWDMTEELMWKAFSDEQKAALLADGYYQRPSEYGEPYTITKRLIEEGRDHLMAGKPFDPGRPVHVFQGMLDDSVPPEHTRRLRDEVLTGGWVRLVEVADGDHRLSRDQDIKALCEVVAELAEDGGALRA